MGATQRMIQRAREVANDGWQVHVVSLGNDLEPSENVDPLICHPLGLRSSNSSIMGHPCETELQLTSLLKAANRLMQVITQVQPDVVHAWCRPAALLVAMAARSYRLIPQRRYQQNIQWEYSELFVQPSWALLPDRLFAAGRGIFDRVWVPHPLVERNLRRAHSQFPINIQADRIRVDHLHEAGESTIDSIPKESARRKLREFLNLSPETKIAGTVAPMIPKTRLKDLIWAADLLNVVRDDFHLVIWGTGSQRDRLRMFADMTEAGPHVHLINPDYNQMPMLAGIDFYWHSHLIEPLAFSLRQAMSDGIPVIAVFGAGTRELIRHQQTGLGVRLGGRDEFARWTKYLIEQPTAAQQLASQGSQFVRKHLCNLAPD